MKKFAVVFEVTAEIELDEKVISVVDDEWRSMLYPLHSEKDIAEHIAYNFVRNRASLSRLDGWADQPDSNANLISEEWELEEVRADAEKHRAANANR